MVIKVYTENQIKNMNITYKVQEECKCSSEDITSCAGSNVITNGTGSNNTNKVSINKASKEELMTLSGVGESKAEAIIESQGGATSSSSSPFVNTGVLSTTLNFFK